MTTTQQIPSPNEGERYIGAITEADGSGHHIYRLPLDRDLEKNWPDAMAHAAENGAELPNRVESALLFATREEGEFERDAYWTREQYAGSDAYAWYQYFANGFQYGNHKVNELRVVLVRRVPL